MLAFYKKNIPLELIIIITFGVIIRIIAIFNLNIIEPDGVAYIQQARALLSGDFSSVFSCELGYLPLSTIFIAGAYLIIGDWLIAGHAVSCVLGSAMLIPLAMILRRFFERKIVFLGVATFSILPIFVYISVYILREPVFIFFVTLGLYFFIRYLDEYKKDVLIYSSLCFTLGIWARIEGFFIILIAAIFIVIYCHKGKFSHLLLFLALPVLVLISINIGMMSLGANINARIMGYAIALDYYSLKKSVHLIASEIETQKFTTSLFLKNAGDQIWLLGAGSVIRNLVKALHYFFFFIIILGLKEAWSSLKFDKRLIFLSLIAATGMFFIYIFCLKQWMVSPRFYAGIVLTPLCFLICFGFKKTLYLLENKLNLNIRWSFLLVVAVIFLICLPKDLRVGDRDKRIYRDIANEISKHEDAASAIKVATPRGMLRWINFYANYDFLSASNVPWCNKPKGLLWEYYPKDYKKFVMRIEKENIDYLLWEQRIWQRRKFLFKSSRLDRYFDRIGEWYHPDMGDIVLYKRKKR